MMMRIGPVLIVTFGSLQKAVEAFVKKYDMLDSAGQIERKWEGNIAGLVLFCRMLFGITK